MARRSSGRPEANQLELALGDADGLLDAFALGDVDGEANQLGLALGDADGPPLALALGDADGRVLPLAAALGVAEGLTLPLGAGDALGEGGVHWGSGFVLSAQIL